MPLQFLEFDLAGAEWVVVAYLSGDENMIRVAESGESPHVATGHLISRAPKDIIIKENDAVGSATDPELIERLRKESVPELFGGDFFLPRTMSIRQAGKKSNHGLNYGMRYRRFALQNEMPEKDAEQIVDLYENQAYPGLPVWQAEIRDEVRSTKTLTNLLGRKIRLFDQPGPELWLKAYSFQPQGTVADICLMGMCAAYEDPHPIMKPARLCAQVHDSILFQYPDDDMDALRGFAWRIKRHMSPELECRGRKFTLGVDCKMGSNWGSMKKLDLGPDPWASQIAA